MRSIRYLGLLWALALAGCAAHPRLPDEYHVNIADIVDRVQCELYEAHDYYTRRHPRKSEFSWLDEMAVAYSLQLSVDVTGAVSVNSDFIHPISAGTFTFGIGAGSKATSSRTARLSFSFLLRDLKPPSGCPVPQPAKGLYFSNGTGMREWLDRTLESFDKSDQFREGRLDTLSHQLEFVVTVDGSLSPSWVLRHARPKSGLTASLKDTHTLTVAFAKPKKRDGDEDDTTPKQYVYPPPTGRRKGVDPETQYRLNQELYNLQLLNSLKQLPQ